jgi:hypothetical protein
VSSTLVGAPIMAPARLAVSQAISAVPVPPHDVAPSTPPH